MTKYQLTLFNQYLKKNGKRLTKPRKIILETLNIRPFEFKDLYKQCKYAGKENVATFYNNIHFLKEERAIREIVFGTTRYYQLILDKDNRFSDNVVFVLDEVNQELSEEDSNEITNYIKNLENFKDTGVEAVTVLIRRKTPKI